MEDILRDINAVVGVTGSFVCDAEGQVLVRSLPGVFDEASLSLTGQTMTQTIAGLKITRRRKVGDIDLLYGAGRLVVKNLQEGCLCILCMRHINVPLLNLTANLAAKKLTAMLKEQAQEVAPQVAVEAIPLARLSTVAQDVMGETGRHLLESEFKKAGLIGEKTTPEEIDRILPQIEETFAVFIGSTRARKTVELMRDLIEESRGGVYA